MSMYKTSQDWMFYVNVYEPTYGDMKNLDNTIFDYMDMIDLDLKYRRKTIPETVPSFATPSTSHTTSTTTNIRTP